MNFDYELPEWREPGSRPDDKTIKEGWQTLQSPPPEWHNWFQHLVWVALKELKEEAAAQSAMDMAFKAIERIMIILELDGKVEDGVAFFFSLSEQTPRNMRVSDFFHINERQLEVSNASFAVADTSNVKVGMELEIFDDTNNEVLVIKSISGKTLTTTPTTKFYKKGSVLCRSNKTLDKTQQAFVDLEYKTIDVSGVTL